MADAKDEMMDYEIQVVVLAKGEDGSVLYSSAINHNLFDKKALDMEYVGLNHNDWPVETPRGEREWHSWLYHDLIDISELYQNYGKERVKYIRSIDMKVEVWEQFSQDGTDLQKAIQVANNNLGVCRT